MEPRRLAENQWRQKPTGSLYIFDWRINEVALGLTLAQYKESPLLGAIQLISTQNGESSWAQTRLALAAGQGYLEATLMRTNGKCGPIDANGAVVLFTDYVPLHCQTQVRRWRTYGAPPQPSPERKCIDEILSKWAGPRKRQLSSFTK